MTTNSNTAMGDQYKDSPKLFKDSRRKRIDACARWSKIVSGRETVRLIVNVSITNHQKSNKQLAKLAFQYPIPTPVKLLRLRQPWLFGGMNPGDSSSASLVVFMSNSRDATATFHITAKLNLERAVHGHIAYGLNGHVNAQACRISWRRSHIHLSLADPSLKSAYVWPVLPNASNDHIFCVLIQVPRDHF